MKDWYTPQELAGLPGMPGTERGVRQWAQKNLPVCRTKVRGKGKEYSIKSLPVTTQAHLSAQAAQALLAVVLPSTAPALTKEATPRGLALLDDGLLDGSTEAERDQARAVAQVCAKVAELMDSGACRSAKAACHTLIASARAGLLPPALVAVLRMARDRRGRPSADGLPSTRALELWVLRQRRGESLLPKKPQPDMTLLPWHVAALELKRRPQKPTTRKVHEQLVAAWNPAWGTVPSYHQLTYFFAHKYSAADLLVGQHQGSALAAQRAYKKRSTDGLEPFVEVHADGWNTHFYAPHPVTGDMVTYEVWHFHELVTRYVTRPSIGQSESTAVILAGLEQYIREMGVPAVWQTDHTGSVKNDQVKNDPVLSVAARAGIEVVHPVQVGNSQANGIAENWNTWLDREARELATYQHPQRMDALAFKRVRRFTDKMVKAAQAGDREAAAAHKRSAELAGQGRVFESFEQARDWLYAKVDKFNHTPHSSLPRMTDPATGQRRHQTPAEAKAAALAAGFKPVMLDEPALIDLFRMHVRRVVKRGMVSPYRQQVYRHADLDAFEGQRVVVAVNIMDGSRVWVKDGAGRLICEAPRLEVTGYRAQSFYEFAQAQRMAAQVKRKEAQIEAIEARMDPARLPIEAPAVTTGAVVVGLQTLNTRPTRQPVAPVLTLDEPTEPEATAAPKATAPSPTEPSPDWYAAAAAAAAALAAAPDDDLSADDHEDRLFLMMRAEIEAAADPLSTLTPPATQPRRTA